MGLLAVANALLNGSTFTNNTASTGAARCYVRVRGCSGCSVSRPSRCQLFCWHSSYGFVILLRTLNTATVPFMCSNTPAVVLSPHDKRIHLQLLIPRLRETDNAGLFCINRRRSSDQHRDAEQLRAAILHLH